MADTVEEARSKVLLQILDVGLDFMGKSFASDDDMGMMADQAAKSLMTIAAFGGMLKERELQEIYRDRSLTPTQRAIKLIGAMAKGMMKQSDFHSSSGEWIDGQLRMLQSSIGEYFLESARLTPDPRPMDPSVIP